MADTKPSLPRLDYTPRVSRERELFGDDLDYFDYNSHIWHRTKRAILRAVKPINPFAIHHDSTDDHVGFGLRDGHFYFRPEPYPNGIAFSNFFPVHFDPVTQAAKERNLNSILGHTPSPITNSKLALSKVPVPKVCLRYISYYNRCKMVNGKEKCADDLKNFMETCPNFALESLREGKKQRRKFEAIQKKQYQEAMKVSAYNEGRTVADISNWTYDHGKRQHLRPDTLWADERYVDVTQEEIDAAKVRYAARLKSEGKQLVGPLKHVDNHVEHEYYHQSPENRHIYAQPIEKH